MTANAAPDDPGPLRRRGHGGFPDQAARSERADRTDASWLASPLPAASPMSDLAQSTCVALRATLGDAAFNALLKVFEATVSTRLTALEAAWRTGDLATVARSRMRSAASAPTSGPSAWRRWPRARTTPPRSTKRRLARCAWPWPRSARWLPPSARCGLTDDSTAARTTHPPRNAARGIPDGAPVEDGASSF